MKKEITLGQLLSVAATLLIAIITGWVTLNNKVSTHEAKIEAMQENSKVKEVKEERWHDRVDNKLEQILIKIENKKDR